MSIGILSLTIGIVCAVASAIAPRPDKKNTTTDYTKIYSAISPKEI